MICVCCVSLSPPSVHMSSQTLVQLVERVHAQAVCPPRRAAEAPGPVIGLYNAVLCHLAEVVGSQVILHQCITVKKIFNSTEQFNN